jgi:class 3 adenylate cyclase
MTAARADTPSDQLSLPDSDAPGRQIIEVGTTNDSAVAIAEAPREDDPRKKSVMFSEGFSEAAENATVDPYASNRYTLKFLDPETEQRYFNFLYVDNGFISGKIFSAVLIFAFAFGCLVFPERETFWPTAAIFPDMLWWPVFAVIGMALIVTPLLFVESLAQHREYFYLMLMIPLKPAWMILSLLTKFPHAYTYGYVYICFLFCAFIVQCRFINVLPFLVVTQLGALFYVSFGGDYWATHTKVEMLYWPLVLIPLSMIVAFEKRSRRSFAEKEKALTAIDTLEQKALVMQRMIAHFFPATPTRDLLTTIGGPRHMLYRDAVMIVTDVVSFTAYTSRTPPDDVIEMLTDMFQSMDTAAPTYGVEKVSTVGDSYCGAIFPQSEADADKDAIARRCSQGVQFCLGILHFAAGQRLRVGVHVGDVDGGFVGCAPPKFDLFSEAMDRTRHMEESGAPAQVHVSREIVDRMGTTAPKGSTETADGLLCSSWDALWDVGCDAGNLAFDLMPNARDPADAADIVEAMCGVAGIKARTRAKKTEGGDGTTVDDDDDVDSDDAKVTADDLAFSLIWLEFAKASVERRFIRSIRMTGINDIACKALLILEACLFVVHLNLGCLESAQDRGATSAIAAVIIGMFCYVIWIGTRHRFHALVTFGAYNAITIIAFMALRADCGGLRREFYVGNICIMYYVVSLIAPQFVLDVPNKVRVAMLFGATAVGVLLTVFRILVIRDDVAVVDWIMMIMIPGFFATSYFADYTLRTTFVAMSRLRKTRALAKGRVAAMATTAMGIMLPSFVTDKLVAMAKDATDRPNDELESSFGDTLSRSNSSFSRSNSFGGDDSSSSFSDDSSSAAAVDFDAISAIWEYGHAVVMFATFRAPGMGYAEVDRLIQLMEGATRPAGVMKVKTMGSTMMCVAGIDGGVSRLDALLAMIHAAAAIRRDVFAPLAVQQPGLHFSIGINCGPCFGAVIGGSGAIFDIFGDTVNVSSRMMSTAANGAVQLSRSARDALPEDVEELNGWEITALPPVQVKGKGVLDVFAL